MFVKEEGTLNMKILILGGTGAMGEHLVNILSKDKENQIFVTTRKNRISNTDNVSYLIGNAKIFSFLTNTINKTKCDVIVDFMVYNTEEFKERVDLFLSSCQQYIFLSSSRVYAESNKPLREDSLRILDICKDEAYLKTDEYALSKARQENFLLNSQKRNWTIIRPYITYSENRLQLGVLEKEYWLYTAINCKALVFSEDISKHITTLTYGYDVAYGISALIGNKKAYGEAFHITGNNSIKWEEVFKIYTDVLKENGYIFETKLKEQTHKLETSGKYQVLYDRYFDRTFDNSKIAQFVDIEKFTKPEIGLRNCLNSFLINPKFLPINIGIIYKIIKQTNGKIQFRKIPGLKQKIKYILLRMHII